MDIVTPAHERDIQTIIDKRQFYYKNLPTNKRYVICSERFKETINKYQELNFINGNELYVGLNLNRISDLLAERGGVSGHAGWYLQQFIKMAYSFVCKEEYYLVWDADVVPVVPLELFNSEGKPYFTTESENHKPYFDTLGVLFDGKIGREAGVSFNGTGHMVIKTSIMRELIMKIEANEKIPGKYFYEKIIWSIRKEDIANLGFSEFETYGNYTYKYYSDLYQLRKLRICRHALMLIGKNVKPQVMNWASDSYDIIIFETKEKKSIISFCLSNKLVREKYTFQQVVHWYMKYIYVFDAGIQNFLQNISGVFWRFARNISEKMGIYDELKRLQNKGKTDY